MAKIHTIKVTEDFSDDPFGRYLTDHPDRSAEKFRESILIPMLNEHDVVTVDLSDSNAYSSSFLEETFGGLIRNGFTKAQLDEKLRIIHEQLPSIVAEAKQYIETASSRNAA